MKHYFMRIVFYGRLEVKAPDMMSAEKQLLELFYRCYVGVGEKGVVNVDTTATNPVKTVDGELEIASFDGEDGNKRVTFRVVANTYRILTNGRTGFPHPTAS